MRFLTHYACDLYWYEAALDASEAAVRCQEEAASAAEAHRAAAEKAAETARAASAQAARERALRREGEKQREAAQRQFQADFAAAALEAEGRQNAAVKAVHARSQAAERRALADARFDLSMQFERDWREKVRALELQLAEKDVALAAKEEELRQTKEEEAQRAKLRKRKAERWAVWEAKTWQRACGGDGEVAKGESTWKAAEGGEAWEGAWAGGSSSASFGPAFFSPPGPKAQPARGCLRGSNPDLVWKRFPRKVWAATRRVFFHAKLPAGTTGKWSKRDKHGQPQARGLFQHLTVFIWGVAMCLSTRKRTVCLVV